MLHQNIRADPFADNIFNSIFLKIYFMLPLKYIVKVKLNSTKPQKITNTAQTMWIFLVLYQL